MAPPKATKKRTPPSSEPEGMFSGMFVFLIENGVQARRLQIWKQKLSQMGAEIEDRLSKRVTHIFAMDLNAIQQASHDRMKHLKRNVFLYQWLEDSLKVGEKNVLLYQWLEDSLKVGEKVSEDPYRLEIESGGVNESGKSLDASKLDKVNHSVDESSQYKRPRVSPQESKFSGAMSTECNRNMGDLGIGQFPEAEHQLEDTISEDDYARIQYNPDAAKSSMNVMDASNKEVGASESSLLYNPPDMNKNITEIFGKLINIYRALGEDRRSFSYYKAIPVIEKLPFKITSVDQVKHLPAIGKSMQDHIHEIVTTGKLSKLEHFETDEKVRTVTLFGEVWGIGPATVLKLYEKGHRTLDDLKHEDSLTSAQRLGLQFFYDIQKRIPRHEVKDMEDLLQEAGEHILHGVEVVCGGSYRRGKATCGDMDFVITHPDGKSHKGFLPRFVQYLKDIKFLREDLIFSIHSTGTDSGVDTYFGLCTYPGRELRHRIDLKVYPRDIYAFGLLAWTGNDVLNRRLRLLAESKGYRLDDTGLFLATQSSAGKRGVKSSASMSFKKESEVFDFLGFPWLEPHDRNL